MKRVIDKGNVRIERVNRKFARALLSNFFNKMGFKIESKSLEEAFIRQFCDNVTIITNTDTGEEIYVKVHTPEQVDGKYQTRIQTLRVGGEFGVKYTDVIYEGKRTIEEKLHLVNFSQHGWWYGERLSDNEYRLDSNNVIYAKEWTVGESESQYIYDVLAGNFDDFATSLVNKNNEKLDKYKRSVRSK